MSRRKTKEEFIKDAETRYGNRFNYTDVIYVDSFTEVNIECPEHGNFFVTPSNFLKNTYGCGECSLKLKGLNIRNRKAEKFLKDVKIIRPNYDFSKFKYTYAKNKSTVICPIHGEFQISPANLKSGKGCFWCGMKVSSDAKRKSPSQFIEDATRVKPRWDLSLFMYIDSSTKGTVVCERGHIFEISPNNLLRGKGCHYCKSEDKGFHKHRKSVLYSLKLGDGVYKIGITNNSVRERYQNKDFDKFLEITEIALSGEEAYSIEHYLKQKYKEYQYQGDPILSNGNTEIFHKDIFKEENIPDSINDLIDKLNLKKEEMP